MSELNSSYILLLILAGVLICICVSLLVAVARIKQGDGLVQNRFLYPASCEPAKCKDIPGFIVFICPRITLFAVLGLLYGVLLACSVLFGLLARLPDWASRWLPLALFLALFAWYGVFINQAARRFWDRSRP